ncbi:MAG TPA: phosphoenolpyruvate--protein phosphotransferase [Candidatus Dormibacteraeota bacterium]|nr:phosphoenolpyruvate--protein phosphotransferase [Candidatus Dormibacteraeota bacterium]
MGELALQGVSAAPGVTTGNAVVLDRERERNTETLAAPARAEEVRRAREALHLAASDLETIAAELRDAGRDAEAEIVETGVLIALDPELEARVERLVSEFGWPAAVALQRGAEEMAAELARLDDPMLAQRADDVSSIGRRAAQRLAGPPKRAAGGVLIAATLGPADVAELAPRVQAIALAGGGVTAHAAIVARSLGLPMVVGLGAVALQIEDGEELVVDGDQGVVVRQPDIERVARAHAEALRRHDARDVAISLRQEPARTKDGHRVHVLANASTAAELHEALQQGAEGVGLLRTELLFLEASAWPSFEQQLASLRPVLEMLRDQVATVRLFDFGGDKTPPFLRGTSARGIDLLLESPQALRTQLAAIVEAGVGTRLRILVPMVTSTSQLAAVRGALRGHAAIGAMIETPEAAAAASDIARECDFLSIGTNDLTQLVLGQDREKSKTAPVLDARVLRLIAAAARAGRMAGIPVDVCGEAASDASAMPVLVGFGVDELSVAAARVGLVRQWVRELTFDECEKGSKKLLDEAGHTSSQRI